MTKALRSAVVTTVSVALAGTVLALDGPGVAIAAGVTITMAIVGSLSLWRARRALPEHPRRWARWIGHTEWLWDATLIAVSTAALWGAVQFGDELDQSIAGAAALGAVAGIAFVKLLDQLASESDWIDRLTQKLAKDTFCAAYSEDYFDDADPPGPLPARSPDFPDQPSDQWFAVHHDDMYGGWDAGGCKKRAEVLALVLDPASSDAA